jgi:hypothetical protein
LRFYLINAPSSEIFISQKPEGVVKMNPLGQITEEEKTLIKVAIPELEGNITKVSHRHCPVNLADSDVFLRELAL